MRLADHISVAPRFSRAINVERDCRASSALDGYVITSTARATSERICESLSAEEIGGFRAWTLTGAYGSGKSAFALFLGSLIRSDQDESATFARRLLQDQHPEIHH